MTHIRAADAASRTVADTESVRQLRCRFCSYGAGRRTVPERCPICGGAAWDFEEWRPFTAFLDDLNRPLTREAG